MISKEELKKLEKLSKLKFQDNDLEKFNTQLNDILEYMKELDELDLTNVESLSNPLGRHNFFREDIANKLFDIEEILKNAPQQYDRFFVVPKII